MILIWEIQAIKSIMDPVAAAKPIEGRQSGTPIRRPWVAKHPNPDDRPTPTPPRPPPQTKRELLPQEW